MSEQNPANAADSPAFILPSGAAGLPSDAIFTFTAGVRANHDVYELPMDRGEAQRRAVFLSHPDDIRQVLNDPSFIKGVAYDPVRRVFGGDGVLTSDGPTWERGNDIARPGLRRQLVTHMIGAMANAGSVRIDNLRTRVGENPVVDLKREMTELTFFTIANVLFGEHAQKVWDGLSHDDLQATFDAIAHARSGLTEDQARRIQHISDKLTGLMHEIIPIAQEQEPNGTLLSLFVHATDHEGNHLDESTIRDEMVTFIFAGYETVALTLTWMFHTLRNHPDVAANMQREIDEVLQGERPNAENLAKLTYTRRVLDEVMRFRPPAPIVAREATREVTLNERIAEDGTAVRTTFYPGNIVLPYIWGAHHHPEYWRDPESFNPDRFLVAEDRGLIQRAYMPFIFGRRSCTGQHVAAAEALTHTALLMQTFNIRIVPGEEEVFPVADITLKPSGPIHAHITPRSQS